MAFVCNAVFGLFCLSAPLGATQIEIRREHGVGQFYNVVNIHSADWNADFLNTDHPGTLPPELISGLIASWTKSLCRESQCVRYTAFCRDKRRPHFCAFAFEVGSFEQGPDGKGDKFSAHLTIYADTKKGMDAGINSLAYLKPGTNGMSFSLAELKRDLNPECPVEMCRNSTKASRPVEPPAK